MASRKAPRKSKPQPNPFWEVGALLSRAEVVGIGLILVAALTLLSLFTSSNGVLTSAWLDGLTLLFGVGRWAFPVAIGGLGIWIMLRAIEGLAPLSWQKPLGLGLLFSSFLIGATLWTPTAPAGGEVGRGLTLLATNALGQWGAWAIATFLAICGVTLVLDQLLLRGFFLLLATIRTWRVLWQDGAYRPYIEPVLPLPSGKIPFWKRWSESVQQRWQRLHTPPPRPSLPPNLVTPVAEPRRSEPVRTPSAAPAAAPARLPITPPINGGNEPDMLTRRPLGGNQEWRLPRLADMLNDWERRTDNDDRIRQQGRIIQETLALFGVPADFEGAYKGPSVTQYLIKPGYIERTVNGEVKRLKVKVAKIAGLANDLALALAAASVRIEAPIPGTTYVGVEVPNQEGNTVGLKELMETEIYQNMKGRLRLALGEDVKGQPIVTDLARMPHLLIAGATGSGKSACINGIISCLLLTHTPDSLRMLMVDPKMVELSVYNGVPHLLSPVVTEVDKAAAVLFWAVKEMERRYTLCSKVGARDLVRYNEYLTKQGEKPLPYIVVIVDEMADLMMAAPEEVEKHICRLAQMARAVGIHLIIATQRPSVDVITGLIKANFPSRIAFAVTSQTDSRVVLDVPGAERLLGRGDMLFMAPDSSKLDRLQGAWVGDEEISRIVRYWKGIRSLDTPTSEVGLPGGETQSVAESASSPASLPPTGRAASNTSPAEFTPLAPLSGLSQPSLFEEVAEMKKLASRDELFEAAVRVVQEEGRGSISLLQRKLRIGYNRSANLVDQLEEAGILGPDEGNSQGRPYLPKPHTTLNNESTAPRIIGGDNEEAGVSGEKPQFWM